MTNLDHLTNGLESLRTNTYHAAEGPCSSDQNGRITRAPAKVLGVLLLSLLSGCVATEQIHFDVYVDSLASTEAENHKKYILLPGNEGVTPEDLQFQEYSQYVKRGLKLRGFHQARDTDDADVAIVLRYGIDEPKTRAFSYTLPVRGQIGVSSSQTLGIATSSRNRVTCSGTTTYTPRYGVVGYTTHVGSLTTYTRHADLVAYDLDEFRSTSKEVHLWEATIVSIGASGDLRRVFPILVAAGTPYLGRSTSQQVMVRLYESDAEVRVIRHLEDGVIGLP